MKLDVRTTDGRSINTHPECITITYFCSVHNVALCHYLQEMSSDSSSADLPSSDVSSEDEVSVAVTSHNKKHIIVKFVRVAL